METRKSNIKVWEDTFKQADSGFFRDVPTHDSSKYTLEDLSKVQMKSRFPDPVLQVINEDTFTMAEKLIEIGYDPLVLNMASNIHPGGGVRKGAFAQEENLFRRSNYYKFLSPKEYPIHDNEVIYSPNVLVFKDKNYNIIEKPFEVACIACAALRNPILCWTINEHPVLAKSEDYELTKGKIRAIFQVAYMKGHHSLVLGALGCGAFHNPPEQIADIFNEILKEYKYCFKYFCFAVLSIKDPNYRIFKEKLKL